MAKSNGLSNKDLLVRIDERQQAVLKHLEDIDRALTFKVDVEDFKPYCEKTNRLWDDRNRIIGWIIGGGLAGGAISQVLGSAVKAIMASF